MMFGSRSINFHRWSEKKHSQPSESFIHSRIHMTPESRLSSSDLLPSYSICFSDGTELEWRALWTLPNEIAYNRIWKRLHIQCRTVSQLRKASDGVMIFFDVVPFSTWTWFTFEMVFNFCFWRGDWIGWGGGGGGVCFKKGNGKGIKPLIFSQPIL